MAAAPTRLDAQTFAHSLRRRRPGPHCSGGGAAGLRARTRELEVGGGGQRRPAQAASDRAALQPRARLCLRPSGGMPGARRRDLHRAAQFAPCRLHRAGRQRRRARAVREADGGHGGRVQPDARGLPPEWREADDCVSPALRGGEPRRRRARAPGTSRRAQVLQLVVFDARQAGGRPPEARARRRHPVRHRCVLHQRSALPVPGRAGRGGGDVGQRPRRAERRGRVHRCDPALWRRPCRIVRDQLQCSRCRRVPRGRHQGSPARRSGVPSTPQGWDTR